MRKNYKKLTAAALTVVMTLGCTMTAFAANATSGDASGDLTGTGDYEGSEPEYPEVKVTLPTVPVGATYIDYIVDPNDLITSTLNASGDAINTDYDRGAEFKSTTGVYFKTRDTSGDTKALYTETSRPITVANESAQDIKLTVKVKQTAQAASGDVIYSNKADFSGDTAKKLYLAVTDGVDTKPITASGDAGAATFSVNVSGKPDNFQAAYSSGKYTFSKKNDASNWATVDYKLTGAVNKNAKWGEGITFPQVQMTWRWEDKGVRKEAAPSVADVTYSKAAGGDLNIRCDLGAGSLKADAITDFSLRGSDGVDYTVNGAWGTAKAYQLSIDGTIVKISDDWMKNTPTGVHNAAIVVDNDLDNPVTFKITVTN